MQKQVNGVTTQYLWDGDDVLKEFKGDGSAKASYFLGATGRQAIKSNGQWYVYLRDTHGSVTGLVDLNGNRVATYENGDYGEALVDQGSVYNPYRWNGEQTDAESGLAYMRNRYYQAATGRLDQAQSHQLCGRTQPVCLLLRQSPLIRVILRERALLKTWQPALFALDHL